MDVTHQLSTLPVFFCENPDIYFLWIFLPYVPEKEECSRHCRVDFLFAKHDVMNHVWHCKMIRERVQTKFIRHLSVRFLLISQAEGRAITQFRSQTRIWQINFIDTQNLLTHHILLGETSISIVSNPFSTSVQWKRASDEAGAWASPESRLSHVHIY